MGNYNLLNMIYHKVLLGGGWMAERYICCIILTEKFTVYSVADCQVVPNCFNESLCQWFLQSSTAINKNNY